MDVVGTVLLVPMQPNAGNSPSSNWRERMDVLGTLILVPLELEVGNSPSSND